MIWKGAQIETERKSGSPFFEAGLRRGSYAQRMVNSSRDGGCDIASGLSPLPLERSKELQLQTVRLAVPGNKVRLDMHLRQESYCFLGHPTVVLPKVAAK